MSRKQLISLAALTLILQSCGDSKDEKNLKRRNKELTEQNAQLVNAQQELEATKLTLNKAIEEKAAAESARKKLEAELASGTSSAADLTLKLKETEASIKIKEEQLSTLRANAAAYDANVQTLNTQIVELQKQTQSLQSERDTLKKSLAEANEASAKTKAELEATIGVKTEIIAAKESEISKLSEQLKALTGSPESLAAEITALNEKLKTAEEAVKALSDERDALKVSLTEANAASAMTRSELEAQLATKDKMIEEKDAQISKLTAAAASLGSSADLASAQAEVAKLKEERDALKASLAQAEAATEKAQQEILAANKKIEVLERSQVGLIKKSLEDIQGLWLNQYKVAGIPNASCYEFVQLAVNGSFTQAVACSDGRVQLQKHGFDRFSAQAIPEQDEIDYSGAYGFVVDGIAASSTCRDASASVLKTGNRLVFEMTLQDFGRSGNFKSRNMIVSTGSTFKGFTNAGLNFVSNQLDYAAMASIAGRANASNLTKAAAVFIGAVEGKGTGISLGCFDAAGSFTAQASN